MENIQSDIIAQDLPLPLSEYVKDDDVLFAVYAPRTNPIIQSQFFIAFGAFWSIIPLITIFTAVIPVAIGTPIQMELFGEFVNITLKYRAGEWSHILILSMLFLTIGIVFIVTGINSYKPVSGWFVGSENRFISYINNQIISVPWEYFNNIIEISGSNLFGNLTLNLKKPISNENHADYPNFVHIAGIKNNLVLAGICRKCINMYDPGSFSW